MKIKEILNISIFGVLIFGFGIGFLLKDDTLISREERRYLTQKDSFENLNILEGKHSGVLEDYMLDQFPFRTYFRKLKSFSNYNVFQKLHNQDIVIYNDNAIKLPMNYEYDTIQTTMNKIQLLKKNMFKYNKCYFVLIPDKSCYYPFYSDKICNYDLVEEQVKNNLGDKITYIPIKEQLELSDYYRTDSHWSQEKIEDVANTILTEMGKDVNQNKYEINTIADFYGVYYSQAALNLKPDDINYLTNDVLKDCTVFNYETNKTTPIYDLYKLKDDKSMDNYDIFLSGSASLLRIDNPNAKENKILYVFRDSYGSSLTPLLIENYSKIFVVDLRYINTDVLSKYISPTRYDDVLFLYSTLLINSPNNFKINFQK